MSDTLVIFGQEYTGVTGIQATDDNGDIQTYIKPAGTVNISENGTVDVSQYASANVDVAGGGGTSTLAKVGASSTPEIVSGWYGPMGDYTADYLTPVNGQTRQDVEIDTAQRYSIEVAFKIASLPAERVAIFGALDATNYPMPAMFIDAGGTGIRFRIPYLSNNTILYYEDYFTTTEMGGTVPLNTEIKVGVEYNGTSSHGASYEVGAEEIVTSVDDLTPASVTGGLCIGANGAGTSAALAGETGAYIKIEDCQIKQGTTTLWPGGAMAIVPLNVTENGTYNAPSGIDGYDPVVVNVSGGGGDITVEALNVTENGTYTAPTGKAYSPVTVNVSGSASDNALLFHFDGNFDNSGNTGAVFADVTGLTISNEQSKFGGTSLLCGTSQKLGNVPTAYDLELGADDFTLDFWCYPTNLAASASTFKVPISFKYRSLAIYLSQTTIQFGLAKTNGSWFNIDDNTVTINNNQWHHVAVVRNGTEIYGFLNGVKVKTVNFGSGAYAPINTMTVGSNSYSNGDRRFSGYIDELRLKIGQAVWTSDFTPPTQPYV